MNSFDRCRGVEKRGMAELGSFFGRYSWRGQMLVIDKGPLAEFLQTTVGDVIMRAREDRSLYAIEVKVEEKHTGNCFLETWSNKPSPGSDMSRPGWFMTLERCDVLACYYLDTKQLYTLPYRLLRNWAFERNRLNDFREVPQGKYRQMNGTHGRIVPWRVLGKEVGFRAYRGPLFDEGDAVTQIPVSQLPLFSRGAG